MKILDNALVYIFPEANDLASAYKMIINRIDDHIVEHGIRDEFLRILLDDEHVRSANLGNGLAIPHAYMDGIDDNLIAVARFNKPIPCPELSNSPIWLVIMLAGSLRSSSLHLQRLAHLVRVFHNTKLIKCISELQEPADIKNALGQYE